MKRGHRVAYAKAEWERGEAWAHLWSSPIPGAPKGTLADGTQLNGWRKNHDGDEWAWIWVGFGTLPACECECAACTERLA